MTNRVIYSTWTFDYERNGFKESPTFLVNVRGRSILAFADESRWYFLWRPWDIQASLVTEKEAVFWTKRRNETELEAQFQRILGGERFSLDEEGKETASCERPRDLTEDEVRMISAGRRRE